MNELWRENKISTINSKHTCNCCASITGLQPLSLWDNPEDTHYYCDQHIKIAQQFHAVRKVAFLEFYSIEEYRNSLPEPLVQLYNEWSGNFHHVEQAKVNQDVTPLEQRIDRFEEKWQIIKAGKRLQRMQAEQEREALQKEKSKPFFQKLLKKKHD
ncbi:hypothetical protein [Priestia abyssalis]|uniref:hypothetical protein n=1 Tax=Priestia abyssalis TaxID=1221450 RepID=UPI0009953606|nr:hypothetical protein [Priestia abyssalis]